MATNHEVAFATLAVKVVVLNIMDINTEDQEFTADVLVEARAKAQPWLLAEGRASDSGTAWTIEELCNVETSICNVIPTTHARKNGRGQTTRAGEGQWHTFLWGKLSEDPQWSYDPGLELLNVKDASQLSCGSSVQRVGPDTYDAVFTERWRGTFTEEFELHDFPFDVQDFHISLQFKGERGCGAHGRLVSATGVSIRLCALTNLAWLNAVLVRPPQGGWLCPSSAAARRSCHLMTAATRSPQRPVNTISAYSSTKILV